MSDPMRMRTNAKVNLWLRVLGRRPDGWHEIETIFHAVGLADSMIVSSAKSEVTVAMRPELEAMAGLPEERDNLVHLVARKLIGLGAIHRGARIEILKRIPVGAGLGGGSGNAAGALVALNELWELGLDTTRLARLALEIGADVPYCLAGGTALATGKGEGITLLPAPPPMTFVLGLSNEPLFTRDVYDDFDVERDGGKLGGSSMSLALGSGDVAEIASLLHNDLEGPAFRLRPELSERKQDMIEAGALGAVMAGSGPTMVGLARDPEHANEVAARTEASFDRVLVTSSRPECIERLD